VVAHVRKASIGRVAKENTHPFQRGPWLFAHNGTLPGWEQARSGLEELIDPSLRSSLRGETDSERCFLLFLSRLRRRCAVEEAGVESASAALAETVALVRKVVEDAAPGPAAGGPVAAASSPELERASTTFLATDGRVLLACRRGRTLYVSSPPPDADGRCEYVAVASEDPGEPPPGGTRAWRLLPEESLLAVDAELRVKVTSLSP
jgi:predicted glutamine amidotransferase